MKSSGTSYKKTVYGEKEQESQYIATRREMRNEKENENAHHIYDFKQLN